MTLQGLLQDVPYEVLQAGKGMSQEISSVAIDSRRVAAGGLFICLLGLSVDGHKYIDDVAKAGAGAVLVEKYDEEAAVAANPWSAKPGRIHPRPPGYTGASQLRTVYPIGLTVIQVENTRKALAIIAANAYGRPADKLSLIGVTGTNGKTTTTHFIEDILRNTGHITGIIGTNGVRIGTMPIDIPFATSTTPDPLELQEIFAHMLERGVKYVVMEVSSHALAFYKVEGLVFDVGVFTNLTQDHLDLHGTMYNYRLAKAQLFAQSRFAVVNADDASTPVMLQHQAPYGRHLTYGLESDAGLTALHINYLSNGMVFDLGGSTVAGSADTHGSAPANRAVTGNRSPRLKRVPQIVSARYRLRKMTGRPNAAPPVFKTPGPGPVFNPCRVTLHNKGRFNIYNTLAAIGTCRQLGLSLDEICKAAAKIQGVAGRIQDVPNSLGAHVLVDYAHSPDSIVKIIKSVREFTTGRVIIVFGCGGDRDNIKRPIMGSTAGKLADYCILTSDNPRTEDPHQIIVQIEEGIKTTAAQYEIIENRRDAIFAGVKMLTPGDALIIAGKGHEDYQIIGTETIHFSDYETAIEALSTLE
ncbi:MAG: UDP-N-acetylmuramoyl-L-alanyl-D-glutamate--2,6-diaminopimelate ligase [Defluviitaleaceae bacterium]|nr:UDP-N-acetylmuramoyl-L-alanyl-D-glutamate--2,6-diaminopimelate ligase [Defluviitaleaceae bacterium]